MQRGLTPPMRQPFGLFIVCVLCVYIHGNVFVFLFLLWAVLKVMKRRKSSDEDNSSGSGGDED